jgi:uncharacterized protein DUF7019
MRFNKMIYFSRRRLETFFTERPPRRLPTMNVEVDLQVATVGLGPAAERDPTDAELHRLRQVRRQLEREAAHFYAPDLRTGDWIYFDLEMGWSTSHDDSDLPDLDDVVLFFGSMASERSRVETSVDLMLCGSTEHLLKKTATAGRMGSGTGWLHKLILKINDLDARGDTEIPDDLTRQALAVPRVNRCDEVARWVFDVIARHHAPRHRSRIQGLARVDLNIPEEEWVPRLVVATPLYVQDASRKPMRLITRLRLHRDLCRRYGRPLWKWHPDLPPRDRHRYYVPPEQP